MAHFRARPVLTPGHHRISGVGYSPRYSSSRRQQKGRHGDKDAADGGAFHPNLRMKGDWRWKPLDGLRIIGGTAEDGGFIPAKAI
jgi:hypothetical protein